MATRKVSPAPSTDDSAAKPKAPRSRKPKAPAALHDRAARIAQRAFELYEARGGRHGSHVEDWLEAERQIDVEETSRRRAK